ncbi:MAG: CHASE domain-containing protein, partial [Pseudomonadota bacterium]
MRASKLSGFVIPIILGLVYFVAAHLSLGLAFAGSNASPIWPPTGIAIAALTFWGLRVTPAVSIAAFAANLFSFYSNNPDLAMQFWIASAIIALGNTAEAFAGAYWLRRDPEFPKLFQSQRSVLRFVSIALLVSAISAGIGTATLVFAKIIPTAIQTTVGMTWWIGDVCGALIFVPFVATLARKSKTSIMTRPIAVTARFALALALIGLLSMLVFGYWIADPAILRPAVFLIFPALGWVAWQHGLRGACSALIIIATFAVFSTTRGFGPFASSELNESLILLDSFLALITTTALLLSADRLERLREGFSNKLREYAPPGIALFGAIAITVLAWHLLSLDSENRAKQRFDRIATEVARQIKDRMQDYQRALRGGAGLFATDRTVARADWKAYVDALRLQESLPGIQGMGFSIRLAPEEREALIKKMQAEGFSNFSNFSNLSNLSMKQANSGEDVTAIIYLEPQDNRNQRALGFDMMTEAVRRAAMVQARDTGQTTISGKLTLLQENGQDLQSGFVMYEPVYRWHMDVSSPEGRRRALIGYISSPFRTHDLIMGTLGDKWPEVRLEIFDGANTQVSELLYADPALKNEKIDHASHFQQEKTLALFEHAWTLRMHSSPSFEAGIDRQKSQFVFVAGGIVSLLLFAMIRLQSLTVARANKLAEQMTSDLQHTQLELEQREKFASVIFEATPEPLLLVDGMGRIVRANVAATRAFGYTQENFLTLTIEALVPDKVRAHHPALREKFILGTESRPMGVGRELQAQRFDGSQFPVEVALASLTFGVEKFVVVSVVDITTHKATETALREISALNTAILDSAAVSVISTTPEGVITSFNRGAELLLGYRADEMIKLCTPAVIHDIDEVVARAAEFSQALNQQIQPGFEVFVAKSRLDLPNTHEWTYIRKNGERLPVLLAVTAIRDEQHAITGFLGVAVDISERKAAEAV